MDMLVDGHFDFLMFPPGGQAMGVHEEIREWIAALQSVSRPRQP
jgi:hypothetical protein